MVAINDEHEHGDGEMCSGCRFRTALAAFLSQSFRAGGEEWYLALGDLRRRMHAALAAIDDIESLPFDDDGPAMPFESAADAIANVGTEMQDLWGELMPPATGE